MNNKSYGSIGSKIALGFVVLLFSSMCGMAALPDLFVELGEQNKGTGLEALSAGDGVNIPEVVQGVSARRISDDSFYFYVKIAHPEYVRGPMDLYVIVEALDDRFVRMGLEYDKQSASPDMQSRYEHSPNSQLLTGAGGWRRYLFFIPAARLGHGQNSGADFRLNARQVAIRKITVTPQKPADYIQDQFISAETLSSLQVNRPNGMEVTFGNDATAPDAAVYKALSVTSVESYVDWAGVEPAEGQWDWSQWDKQVDILKKAKLKWVPFLIAGPAYATPLWYQKSPRSQYYKCLEHQREGKVQTIFNPEWRFYVDRFIKAFADRYRDTGVIESVLLGITGIYGESIYPAGPEGEWTAKLTGVYHNHMGWWAGDEAVESFRTAMQKKYVGTQALNQAWQTNLAAFSDVKTFVPGREQSDRARADFAEWYQASMTDFAVYWVKTARRHFPKTEIYLCTGGDGNPMLGADFTAQTASIASDDAGVRITNEGSDYLQNFVVTREVAAATRLYGTYCGFEPASSVNAAGIIGRIYNATASGARQMHDYTPNTMGGNPDALKNFRAYAPFLTVRHPRVSAAVYISRETWALEPEAISRIYHIAYALRDVADIDFITRRAVADGHLRAYKTVVLAESPVLEPGAASAFESWVRQGGALVAATRPAQSLGGRLYDHTAWRSRMLPVVAENPTVAAPVLEGKIPSHWELNIGSETDAPWLTGDWFSRESGGEWPRIPGAGKRWTGAQASIFLPTVPGADYTLKLSLVVPGAAVAGSTVELRVNGKPVGSLNKAGVQDFTCMAAAAVLGQNNVSQLEIISKTWRPSEVDKASKDERSLGVALRHVEWVRHGAEIEPLGAASMKMVVSKEKMNSVTKAVGRGRVIYLPGLAASPETIARVFAAALPRAEDGQLDGRFATDTEDGVLWYDKKQGRIWMSK